MPLLQLSGIGKIYVSDGTVSVGIRGIDLSFERGEFVAVTGASGSGKSTLLNVISGMDSYEEGELYIEDSPTSHYLESDWEEYRSKYISFIFQDYNILESYTVLQNVELALMHIKDRRERRKRAVELLQRVGMEKHLKQKGSKLSGGQKQRTVIARALAKDSPIILADEPTGNLDEATSKEIIDLLREVSKDKLLIIVTHNYDEVEHCATRHIRIFDGAVEFDRGATSGEKPKREEKIPDYLPPKKKKLDVRAILRDLRDGITLGGHVFASRPKLAVFTCILMAIGMLGVFLMTSVCFDDELFEYNEYKMFEEYDGRLVVVRRDGGVPTEDEIRALAEEFGAEDYYACDYLLDYETYITTEIVDEYYDFVYTRSTSGFIRRLSTYTGNANAALPENDSEIFLSLPISKKEQFEHIVFGESTVLVNGIVFTVTGIEYYYDNNISPSFYVTDKTYTNFSSFIYFSHKRASFNVKVGYTNGIVAEDSFYPDDMVISTKLGRDIYLYKFQSEGVNSIELGYTSYDGISHTVDTEGVKLSATAPEIPEGKDGQYIAALGSDLIYGIANDYAEDNYKQFSLFFKDDLTARRVRDVLLDRDYIALTSDSSYKPDPFEKLGYGILLCLMLGVWLSAILCLAFFIRLCQSRSIVTFKNDIAIMRSMGIKTSVIKISMYMRSVIALIPAVGALAAVAYLIFTSPSLNGSFTYLYSHHYALICIGMLLIALRVSQKQQSKLFLGSVKKTLTGGEIND